MVQLYLEGTQHKLMEGDRQESKTTNKEVLGDNSLVNLRTRNCLTTRRPPLALRETTLCRQLADHFFRHL